MACRENGQNNSASEVSKATPRGQSHMGTPWGGDMLQQNVMGEVDSSEPLELEVDERLHVGGDELVGEQYGCSGGEDDQRQRHSREPQTVTALEAVGQPMDDHAYNEQQHDVLILLYERQDDTIIPRATDLVHHLLGSLPGFAVGGSGVEVTCRAEEQTREGDEDEGLEDIPSLIDPTHKTVGIRTVTPQPADVPDRRADPEDEHPHLYHIYERIGAVRELARGNHADCQQEHDQVTDMFAQCPPALVDNHAHAIESAPDDEVPTCAVP